MSRTRRSLVAIALVGATGAGLTAGEVASAATNLRAKLSGKAETPVAGNGRGRARIEIDIAEKRVCFDIRLRRVGTVVAGHIHKGAKGEAGPVFVALFEGPTRHPKGCAPATVAQLRAIKRHPRRYYVNVHTAKFPAGAARGPLPRATPPARPTGTP